MQLDLVIQNASTAHNVPAADQLRRWVEVALAGRREHAQLGIRLVDETEGAELNRRFRDREGATNVLSCPFEPLPGVIDCDLIGDLAVCAPVVIREAREQGKTPEAHWAHMLVHGVLHLLGYDHLDTAQATEMEGLERHLLCELGFPPPYEET